MKFVTPLLFLASGILLGWVIFHNSSQESENTIPEATSEDLTSRQTIAVAPQASGFNESTSNTPLSFTEKQIAVLNLSDELSLSSMIEAFQLIQGMNENELSALIEETIKDRDSSAGNYQITVASFMALLETDRDQALSYYAQIKDPYLKMLVRNKLYNINDVAGLEESIAELNQLENPSDRSSSLQVIISRMAESNPKRAFEILQTEDDASSSSYHEVFSRWSEVDPESAFMELNNLPPGSERIQALGGYFKGLAKNNPIEAARVAQSLEYYQERLKATQTVAAELISKDLNSGLDYIFGLEDGKIKSQTLLQQITHVAREDPQLAFETVQQQLSGRTYDSAMQNLISIMAQNDIDEAIDLLNQLPYGRAYERSVSTISSQWGRKDPLAALEWARGLEEGKEKKYAVKNILMMYAREQPEEAKNLYWSLEDTEQKKSVARTIAQQISHGDHLKALEWVQSLPDKEISEHAYDSILRSWIYRDANGALSYMESMEDSDSIQKQASIIATQLAQSDLNSASEWALSLDDSEAKKDAVNRIAREWLDHNLFEASKWISTLEAGDARDAAVEGLVNEIRRSDPVSAFTWAATIDNENERKSNVRSVVDEMKNSGQEDLALREINSSNLSVTEKEYLLKHLDSSK